MNGAATLLKREAPGELDHDGRALTQGARHADGATVSLDDAAGDVEPDAETAVVPERSGSLEPRENAIDVLGSDADSAIRHREARPRARSLDTNVDRVSVSVLDGVGDQVDDDLFDARLVPRPNHTAPRLKAHFGAGQ